MAPRGPVEISIAFGPTSSPNVRRAETIARALTPTDGDRGPRNAGLQSAKCRIEIDADVAPYARLYELIGLVKGWRSTAIEIAGEPEPAWVVQSMLHCARGWLRSKHSCGERYWTEIWAKCWTCPLFDQERAESEIAATRRLEEREVIDVPGAKVVLGDAVSAGGFTEQSIAVYRKRPRTL